MKIITKEQCVQGSEEWLKLRLGVATASNFDKIITTTGKESATLEKYALQLATEKMLIEPEPSYKNETMQRGNDLEPVARQTYQEATLEQVEEVTMIISDCDNYGYSPDGLIGKDGLIEIKCPLATTHSKYLIDNRMPTDYWQQVQGGLWVSGRKWCDFISFHPNFKEKQLFIVRVERDEQFIEKLAVLVDKTIKMRDEFLTKIKNK
jgi:putative phage-type endonuclease